MTSKFLYTDRQFSDVIRLSKELNDVLKSIRSRTDMNRPQVNVSRFSLEQRRKRLAYYPDEYYRYQDENTVIFIRRVNRPTMFSVAVSGSWTPPRRYAAVVDFRLRDVFHYYCRSYSLSDAVHWFREIVSDYISSRPQLSLPLW